eukprot:CAMPEP_0178902868 /NCGR_PEP_ID=MMETSP0786-20121207/4843_1 /TAXON_ID=186022 /ORGANISM="Thalassionema frauenfeldii, Strain CCMP 1798" /LENGTH=106 /DNA_ID=CAMNT_0020574181 /DNA_START=1040 /DNA_END=1357 /DNA_ORIENTATION=+
MDARPNRSGVYARVSGAYDWIQSQICDLATVNCPALCGPTPVALQLLLQLHPQEDITTIIGYYYEDKGGNYYNGTGGYYDNNSGYYYNDNGGDHYDGGSSYAGDDW